MESPYPREQHEHSHDTALLEPTISNTSSTTYSEKSSGSTGSVGPSPIKIDHDYDLHHNLNHHHHHHHKVHARPSVPQNSLLSPGSTTFTIPESPTSQYEGWTPITPQSANTEGFLSVDDGALKNPFGFTPQQYVPSGRTASSSQENLPGKRKGHKYRHSSIHTAHQIFQSPTPRAPLAVPASLPVPTRREAWLSISRTQNLRLIWCLCHFLMAGVIQFAASGSLALAALSRLMFFDAAGAVSCVAVDVMTNFEVWSRSTIRHPFGLGRADVLAGFGMAVFIAFMGLDIISHGTQHALENLGNHEAHSAHSHNRPSTTAVLCAALGAAAATVVSAIGLGNHMRIGRAVHVPWLARWGSTLGNPSHFLTLSCCAAALLLPAMNKHVYKLMDPAFAFIIAGFMIAFGSMLGTRLGNILLMAYTHASDKHVVSHLITDIEADSAISAVDDARIWQVHYGLGLADLKIRYKPSGQADEIAKLRQRITSLIRSRLNSVYAEGKGPRWDISIQVSREKD